MMNEENEIEEFAPWLVIIITLIGGCPASSSTR